MNIRRSLALGAISVTLMAAAAAIPDQAAFAQTWVRGARVRTNASERQAATIVVSNLNNSGSGSLRQAIADAVSGDTIIFSDGSGGTVNFHDATPDTIMLHSGQLNVVGKTITISGPADGRLTISPFGSSRVFNIDPGAGLTLEYLTLRDGRNVENNAYGGAIFTAGTLNINNCTLTANFTSAGGSAFNIGGAIYAENAVVTITNSTISGNGSIGGSTARAGAIQMNGANTVLTLLNSTITNNSASGTIQNIGGGIVSNGALIVRNTIIAGNSAAIDDDVNGPIAVNENSWIGNFAALNLGPLAFAGGPTQTHPLLAGSAAIDAGSDAAAAGLTYDQRGAPYMRKFGAAVDIGAFERRSTTAAEASVSGRVFASAGRGLTNAVVTITDDAGGSRSIITGRGGSFAFAEVETGRTYVISVGSQRYTYAPQAFSVNDSVSGLEFRPQ